MATPRVFPEDDMGVGNPNRLRGHDLVGDLLLDQAVLVNPGLMGKGVCPDDRLVRLDVDARDLCQQSRGLVDILGPDSRPEIEKVLSGLDRHHDLFHGAVSGPLADPDRKSVV